MIAAIFSGQGSQYVGMAADIAKAYPKARLLAEEAKDILQFDLLELMAEGPVERLQLTHNTQPALYLHECMVLAITGVEQHVHAVAGHSLGEFTALHAAGVIGFAEGLSLVRTRGELMLRSGQQNPGTMAAVVGLGDDVVQEICRSLSVPGGPVIVAANFNAPGQVVVSGSAELVRSSVEVFKQHGARMVKELNVSGAFHSPLLADVREEWQSAVLATPFKQPTKPVYLNVSGEAATNVQTLQNAAIEQMTSPVQWTQTLRSMHSAGIKHYIEVGPQAVLQGLVKRTLADVTTEGLDKREDCERYIQNITGT